MIIEPGLAQVPISRQCELVGLPTSTYYYQPATESDENLLLMRLIDEIYTDKPFYGKRRITVRLNNDYNLGFDVNKKRVCRLMALMGLEAIYPKPNLSKAAKNHIIFPYLLRGKKITHSDQVWAADITYIRMNKGFLYLIAIIDWYSRYVISWQLSNTMDVNFCLQALKEGLETNRPIIFNTDQGSQFTSHAFTGLLKEHGIDISMNGKGRCLDNVFVERLWWSLKHEEVYLTDYLSVLEAEQRIGKYFEFFNHERRHQALDYKTPFEVYMEGKIM